MSFNLFENEKNLEPLIPAPPNMGPLIHLFLCHLGSLGNRLPFPLYSKLFDPFLKKKSFCEENILNSYDFNFINS